MNLIVVCYDFYFEHRIGGNRWRSMVAALRQSHEVMVIGAGKPLEYELKEGEYIINSRYPKAILSVPKNFSEKLQYRLALWMQRLLTYGSLYDRAARDEKAIVSKLNQITRQFRPDAIIASGAPFSLLHVVAKYALQKGVKSVIDFRDPWTWGSGYGFLQLSKKRLAHERSLERIACETADIVMSPSEQILDVLQKKYNIADRAFHLPHGISPTLLRATKKKARLKRQGSMNLIYAGTLYEGFESIINHFHAQKEQGIDFTLDIYTLSNTRTLEAEISAYGLEEKILIRGYLSSEELVKKMIESDGALILYPPRYKEFVSTKFIELAYLGLPILLISKNGKAADFVIKNDAGLVQESLDLASFNAYIENRLLCRSEHDFREYYYSSLADKLIRRIE